MLFIETAKLKQLNKQLNQTKKAIAEIENNRVQLVKNFLLTEVLSAAVWVEHKLNNGAAYLIRSEISDREFFKTLWELQLPFIYNLPHNGVLRCSVCKANHKIDTISIVFLSRTKLDAFCRTYDVVRTKGEDIYSY